MAENTFDRFTVFFTGDTVFLDRTAFPLGQLTTDVQEKFFLQKKQSSAISPTFFTPIFTVV